MKKIDINWLESTVSTDIVSKKISGKYLLDRFCVIDDDSRKSAAYLDPRYAPTYYHLGKYIEPISMLEIGFDLGLLSASFMISCKSVENFVGFKQVSEEYVPLRLGKRNVKSVFKKQADFYVGNIYDNQFDQIFSSIFFDLVILNIEESYDKHLEYLDFIWPQLTDNGLIIAEYIERHTPSRDAFFAFCESKNRTPISLKTRYGTGILEK